MTETITSIKNPNIKHLIRLQQKSSERKKEQIFVLEGKRELTHCINAGYSINSVFVNRELIDISELPLGNACRVYEVSDDVYSKIAYREGTEGVVALVTTPSHSLNSLSLPANPIVVVLEGVEKPGNLGAILRSADAAGVDAVIFCDPLTDLYNPNLIRASIGAVFTVPCAVASSSECISFLKDRNIAILTAQLQDSKLYYDTPMNCPTAIVMGTEATGLTNRWREAADAHIRIPMLGRLDSLNVSVSAAILMFEAVRQRQKENRI